MGITNAGQARIRRDETLAHASLVSDAAGSTDMRNTQAVTVAAAVPSQAQLPGTTPLREVFDLYLSEKGVELKAKSTLPSRRSHLNTLHDQLYTVLAEATRAKKRRPGPPTLDDFTVAYLDQLIKPRVAEHLYDARGKAAAARAVATWLADSKRWYVGDHRLPISVLFQLKIPKDKTTGRPIYSEDELQTIRHVARSHPTRPYLHLAMQLLDELGTRAGFEAMTLLRRDVHLATRRGELSYIQIREDNTKTDAGRRDIPVDTETAIAFHAYLDYERADYAGEDDETETFVLTDDGLPYTYGGWNSVRRRFKALVEKADPRITYQASRNRGTRTAALRKRKMQDSEIMQAMGWKSSAMIGRYAGKISLEDMAERMGIR